jgi:hypothetical protein
LRPIPDLRREKIAPPVLHSGSFQITANPLTAALVAVISRSAIRGAAPKVTSRRQCNLVTRRASDAKGWASQ